MTTAGLIAREIRYRKLNFALSVLAITAAAALFVAMFMISQASSRETTRLMRDLGFNLRIVPRQTDLASFLVDDSSPYTMPEDCVHRMARHPDLLYSHLLAVLQKRIPWRERTVVLTGIAEEVSPPGRRKPPMIFSVKPGKAVIGYELARSLGIREGDTIDVLDRSFTVVQCLDQTGTQDDVRVYGNLADVQEVLDLDGQINEIKALECLCLVPGKDQSDDLRAQLEAILPEAKVIRIEAIASARQSQRLMIDRVFGLTMPFVLVVSAAWVGVLALLNVQQRQPELGLLRALGYGACRIASLVLGKAAVAGVLGGAFGIGVGTTLGLVCGPVLFPVTADKIVPAYEVFGWLLVAAPALAALASAVPAMVAVMQDPAVTLSEAAW